uniref:Uncharacterized protein n=1 Tax=Bionectria ochroleuca TaxID=29856 RepID=A0A8H7NLS8_BIOOC
MGTVNEALAGHPYSVIVWGEEALRKLGAPIPPGLDHEIMLVVEDRDMADAGKRLEEGKFQHVPWSFGIDAERRTPMDAATTNQIMNDFRSFDQWTEHYVFRRKDSPGTRRSRLPSSRRRTPTSAPSGTLSVTLTNCSAFTGPSPAGS